jgi:hypothetical protein
MSGRLDVELMMGPMKIIVVRVCGGGWGILGGGGGGGETACLEVLVLGWQNQWRSQDQNLPMAKLLLLIIDIVFKYA